MIAKFISSNPEVFKFGFFETNGQKSLSKFEAWKIAQNNNIQTELVYYNFNDDVISNYDWTVEPSENIYDLYRQRAEYLRNKYDYIVVLFSGGVDSYMTLHSFLDNNIHIDEIITCYNLKYLDKSGLFNQEVFKSAIPHLENLNLNKLGIKLTLADIGDGIINQYSHEWHKENFMYHINGISCNWTGYLRSGLFKNTHAHHIKLSEQGKNIAYVWGFDKPNIFCSEDNKFYFSYVDSVPDFGMKKYAQENNIYGKSLKNIYDEAFFVTPDDPKIVIKQCHLLLNEIKQMKPDDLRLTTGKNFPTSGPYVQYNNSQTQDKISWIKKKEVEKIIYPNAPHQMFGDDKIRGSTMYTKRDAWFFRMKHENRNKLIELWKKTQREHPNFFKYLEDGTPINTITMFGKKYFLERHT